MLLAAAEPVGVWDASSPVWNLLSALGGGLIAALSAWALDARRGAREVQRANHDVLRDLYRRTMLDIDRLEKLAREVGAALRAEAENPGRQRAAAVEVARKELAESNLHRVLLEMALFAPPRTAALANRYAVAAVHLRNSPVDEVEADIDVVVEKSAELVTQMQKDLGLRRRNR